MIKTTESENMTHESRDKDLSHLHPIFTGGGYADLAYSDDDIVDADDCDHPDYSHEHDIFSALVDVPDQGYSGQLQESSSEHVLDSRGHLPDPRGAGRRLVPKTNRAITDKDFDEGPERDAFLYLKHFISHLLIQDIPDVLRQQAYSFCFRESPDDFKGVTFDLCCAVLSCKPDVLRLRLCLAAWEKALIWTPLHLDDHCDTPELIQFAVMSHGGIAGLRLSNILWRKPGITTQDLIMESAAQRCDDEDAIELFMSALGRLSSAYIISSHNDRWYLTGSNPIRKAEEFLAKKGVAHRESGFVTDLKSISVYE